MKQLKFILILAFLTLRVQAQSLSTENQNFITIGTSLSIYQGGILSIDAKWVREKKTSFILQLHPYSYSSSSSVKTNLLSNSLNTLGITIKPGIIPLQHHGKYQYFYLAIQGVATYNTQQLTLLYNDAFGENKKQFNQTNLTFGAEILGNIHHKVSKHIYLETGIRAGIKPKTNILKNPEIDNYNSYYNYAPSQGFGKGYGYINILVGLGYTFN